MHLSLRFRTPRPTGHLQPTDQTLYLAKHLEALGVCTLVLEEHYIDRHYMEEVSLYYSRCLNPPPNSTRRIHAFSKPYTDSELDKVLAAATGNRSDRVEDFKKAYCGYIVIRPLPSVPIGRTVLKHLDDIESRKFPTCYAYPVHFMGLRLEVEGLAFQQQDRAVAACATTAIWSALQRVCRRDGARPPTSWQITDAAVRHFLPEGRAYPSPGLTIEQMCEALRSFEFAPDVLRFSGGGEYFLLLLSIYLRSGIPVILMFEKDEEGHAVCVVGYREDPSIDGQMIVGEASDAEPVAMRNLNFSKIYIHDDRLGPYARAEFKAIELDGCDDQLTIHIDWPNQDTEVSKIKLAAIPLYPKLRTTAGELFETATPMLPLMNEIARAAGTDLGLEMFFSRSGEYQSSLYSRDIEPKRLISFQRSIALSRYIGVHRWYLDEEAALDFLWDTTDTLRQTRYSENLLGIVSLSRSTRTEADKLAKSFGVIAG